MQSRIGPIQNNKNDKTQVGVGIMNKMGKLEEKVRHNYVVRTGGTSF